MSRRCLLLLIVCLAMVWFLPLDYRKLVHPDEGRYAEIAREMAVSGDFVTPRLNGIKYFEKPPLQYWVTAGAFNLFGPGEWSARLWTALTGFIGILLTGWCAGRLFGRETGLAAAAVLAGSFLYVALGHINTLDMAVSVLMTAALFLFLVAEQRPAAVRPHRRLILSAWALLGLAVLSKGLMGLVLPGAVLVLYALFTRQPRVILRARPMWGLGVLLLVTAPWFIAVSLANPEFPHFFFIHEHFQRFLATEHRRTAPAWYFVPVLLVGLLPWLSHLLAALVGGIRRVWQRNMSNGELGLWLWSGFIFCFFSVSNSKLPSYVLPIFPTLAVLIGYYLTIAGRRALLFHAVGVGLLGVGLWLAAPLALGLADDPATAQLYGDYLVWIRAACLLLAAGGGLAAFCYGRDRRLTGHLTLGSSGLLFASLLLLGHDTLSANSSGHKLAQALKPRLTATTPIYLINYYEQTLPFYLGRTVTLVNYLDEFEYGLQQEPEKLIRHYSDFVAVWRSPAPGIAVMTPHRFEIFAAQGVPMREIFRDARRVAVVKP